MRSSPLLICTSLAAVAVAALVACDRNPSSSECVDIRVPGVVVYVPGIDVVVRDTLGRGAALGARVVVYNVSSGADSVVTVGTDTLRIATGFSTAGTYSVRVSKTGYRDATISPVVVNRSGCGIAVTQVPVTLQPVPGSASVRSLAIIGTEFLVLPGDEMRLVARLDADPEIPTAVRWRLSDTALAHLDPSGLVTAKCSRPGGIDTVTATLVSNPSVRAIATFGVAKQRRCE